MDQARFAVRGTISEDAVGIVYLVRDTVQERHAAMRVVRLSRSVINEVKILRALSRASHPFLLEPYSGTRRHDWESPSGDFHILTVRHLFACVAQSHHLQRRTTTLAEPWKRTWAY